MRTSVLIAALSILGPAAADEVLTTAAEVARAAADDRPCSFDITATALSPIFHDKIGCFNVMDESGCVGVDYRHTTNRTPFAVGDRLRIRGLVYDAKNGTSHAFIRELEVLSHGRRPEPTDVTPADIYGGRFASALVRVSGTVVDAFRDEVNPDYAFIALACGGETIYLPSLRLDDATLAELIDATVSIVGTCEEYRNLGPRARLGYEVNVYDRADITVIRPAPSDPFDLPLLRGSVRDVCVPRPGERLRRRISGQVAAIWRRNRLLLRTQNGVTTVALARGNPPRCGEFIEAAGIPETDFYNLNLSRAIWREAAPFAAPDPPPEDVTADYLLTDSRGRRSFRIEQHGRLVRISGTVRNLPRKDGEDAVLHILSGSHLIPIDASAAPRAFDRIEVGCEIEVTGVCIMVTENWRPQAPFPHVTEMTVAVRGPDDLRVLSRPTWWTTSRLVALVSLLLVAMAAILVWNRFLRRLVERRGRQLFKEQVAHANSEMRIRERTRLAVELHDSIAQNLAGIQMEVEAARDYRDQAPREMNGHLDFASLALQSCRDDLRNCMWDLRNSALEARDMNEAVRMTVQPHAAGVGLSIRFNVPRSRISDNTLQALLKAIRELTLNAIRHGGASSVKVAGELDEHGLMCSVRDDGCGFDPEDCPGILQGHFGLQGVRERIEGLGGSFTITSAPGRGTKAVITLPPHDQADNQESQ